jgi:hypothetical protein
MQIKLLLFWKAVTDQKDSARQQGGWVRCGRVRLIVLIGLYAGAAFIALFFTLKGTQDAIGYLASLFVLSSFASRAMIPLRLLALLSNAAFISYAYMSNLPPVLLLHALLLPVNALRVWQHVQTNKQLLHGASAESRRWSQTPQRLSTNDKLAT